MSIYTTMYTEILARLAETERQALFDLVADRVDSKPYFPFKGQEAYPYWTNRLGSATYTNDGYGMDILNITRAINLRLVVGNVDEGYDGEVSVRLNQFVADFVPYMSDRGRGMLRTPLTCCILNSP
jgi:hypothetical protein